jgi:hypothetical protein
LFEALRGGGHVFRKWADGEAKQIPRLAAKRPNERF